jgi:hypothetical protein
MTIVDRINAALIRYLNEEVKIKAVSAEFDITESSDNDGCDTCGHGASDMSFGIRYKLCQDAYWRLHEEEGDPLQFLPTLLAFDTES